MLIYDPDRRASPTDLLTHPYLDIPEAVPMMEANPAVVHSNSIGVENSSGNPDIAVGSFSQQQQQPVINTVPVSNTTQVEMNTSGDEAATPANSTAPVHSGQSVSAGHGSSTVGAVPSELPGLGSKNIVSSTGNVTNIVSSNSWNDESTGDIERPFEASSYFLPGAPNINNKDVSRGRRSDIPTINKIR